MKRLVLKCTILLSLSFLFLVSGLNAQTVKIKREAMSPTRVKGLAFAGISNPISSGLRVVGKGTRVYLSADTTGTVTSFEWTFVEKPAGSVAVIDSANKKFASFTADLGGRYIVQVTANGSLTHKDTLQANTYLGTSNQFGADGSVPCGLCHHENYNAWSKTLHATIFKDGITGNLEVEGGKGAYATTCFKCHTSGYDTKANNNNFGIQIVKAGYDTTWYKGLEYRGGDYWTPTGDQTAWNLLASMAPGAVPMASIGCESCHGPGKEHNGDAAKIGKSFSAGVCNQCHDSMTKHRLGSDYNASAHAVWADGSHTGRLDCYPCHSGSAFAKWTDANKPVVNTTSGKDPLGNVIWDASDANVPVTCVACHDPHGSNNPYQLRTVAVDTLKNGYKIPATVGGNGRLCMNCHRSRYAQKVTTVAPYYGFADRFNPHGSPQTDMYLGQNAYEFNKSMAGYSTHTNLENGCVTCHLQARSDVGSTLPNHQMGMTVTDAKGVETDLVGACKTCHGSSITKFDDIKAIDYDGNGKVEGVKTEVANLMQKLKDQLPKDAAGEVINMKVDQDKIANKPKLVQGIYDYYFIKNDGSGGMHNTKYTVALLQNALTTITGVTFKNTVVPTNFTLSQNYPNPFNPTTQIVYSVPSAAHVKLSIYNTVGQLVSTLTDSEVMSGSYTATWNGRDSRGNAAASGIYLYRLEVVSHDGQNFNITKKMVLAK